MNTEIIKIEPEKFGLSEEAAKNITKDLPQILSEREALVSQYDEIIKSDIELPETARKAGELRKLIKNNRTKGIENWHEVNKEYFLRGGQFVDAIKRKEIAENLRMEEALTEIEKHQEIKEAKRKEELKQSRAEQLAPYIDNASIYPLGEMTEDAFQDLLQGQIFAKKAREEAAAKAEQERIEVAKAEAARIEAQRIENERLKAEAEAREKEIAAEREKQRLEAEKRENELAKERAEKEAKLKQEREAREKAEAELEAKRKEAAEIEAKRIAEEKAKVLAEKKAKNAPDKVKLTNWVDSISPASEVDVQAADVIAVAAEINEKFKAFKAWAKTKIAELQ